MGFFIFDTHFDTQRTIHTLIHSPPPFYICLITFHFLSHFEHKQPCSNLNEHLSYFSPKSHLRSYKQDARMSKKMPHTSLIDSYQKKNVHK